MKTSNIGRQRVYVFIGIINLLISIGLAYSAFGSYRKSEYLMAAWHSVLGAAFLVATFVIVYYFIKELKK